MAKNKGAWRLHPCATPSGCRVRAFMAPFVKLFDALNTPESLFIFRGTGRGGRVKKVGVYPEYPDRTGAAVLGRKKKETW